MNEPLINPLWFYLIDVCEKTFWFTTLSSILLVILMLVHYAEANSCYNDDEKEEQIKSAKKLAIPFAVCLVLFLAIPSQNTLYKMFIASQITSHNINVAGETIDKVIDKAVEKIVKIKEAK